MLQVEHIKLLKFFVLVGVLASTKAFGPPKGIPAAPPNTPVIQDIDEYFYPCYTSINCVYKGTDEHKRAEECLGIFNEKDVQISLEWLNKELKSSDYKDVYDAIEREFCQLNGEVRKKEFNKIAQGGIEMFAMGCETRYPQEVCDHFEHMVDCFLELLTDLNEEEKCDIEEYDKNIS
ncbi:hypothetical protein NPIL_118361 [Nephila pilipes]|uniref:DUF19 domain-containing protein n=1 Tax=Nephila pilipes TaxID=299642 RepID=A0A8X6P5V9_NEPPI|nr:hypothetical protein NPIL_118361 [Nephila pilipes]